jgi:polyvinyl alcohol dehydrogenase (cytochrome)
MDGSVTTTILSPERIEHRYFENIDMEVALRIRPELSLFAFCAVTMGCSARGSTEPQASTGEALLPLPLVPVQCLDVQGDWPMFGQNVCNTRAAVTGGLISPLTASKLGVRWVFSAAGDVSATPAVVDGQVYVPDWGGMISRIDGRTGQTVWSKSVAALVGLTDDAGAPPLNLAPPDSGAPDVPAAIVSRDTPAVTGDTVVFGVTPGTFVSAQPAAWVVAVDRRTGALKWKTQVETHPAAQITGSPVIDGNRVYVGVSSGEEFFAVIPGYPCCSFRGSVVALDVTSGKVLWKTPTIDDATYLNGDGTLSGYAGAAVWSTPVVDRRRNSLYVTTGNNYHAAAGALEVPAGDHIEAIMALDLASGVIKWSTHASAADVWNLAYYVVDPSAGGPDWDFGSGPNLFSARIGGKTQDVLGAGQKSGWYWALNPDDGSVIWKTQIGPGGHLGGIHWGTAVDPFHVYVGVNDETGAAYTLGGSGPQAGTSVTTGSWAALDPATGEIQWQIANPALAKPLYGASVNGPVTVVNGVMFAGSMDPSGTMFAIDGATGSVLWSFASGGTVYGGPAVADGTIYWGSGYPNARLQFGTASRKLYAFQVRPFGSP